ncbi:Endonuclease/Exonuclease/phosphatase family protein [Cryptosporidium felis]|nr:Endonuclease/Exonuclease/phosphatase family protein [Cryptosporidium felis]
MVINQTNSGYLILTENEQDELVIIRLIIGIDEEFDGFLKQFCKGNLKANKSIEKISITMNRSPSECLNSFTKRLSLNLKKQIESYLKSKFEKGPRIEVFIALEDQNQNEFSDQIISGIINTKTPTYVKVCIKINNEKSQCFYYIVKKNLPFIESIKIRNEIRWGLPIVPNIIITKGNTSDFTFKWYLQYYSTKENIKYEALQWLPSDLVKLDDNQICDWKLSLSKESLDKIIENIDNYSIILRIILKSENSTFFDTIYRFCQIKKPIERSWREERVNSFNICADFSQNSNITRLKIVTFNILSEICAQTTKALNEMYTNCPRYALHANYRRSLLARELIDLNADVIGLQEVQPCLYDSFIQLIMNEKGYCGIFNPELAGVCTFFKRDKFQLLDSETFLFRKILAEEYPEMMEQINTKWPDFNEYLLESISTVFQITILEHKVTKDIYLFGNTHFYYHPLGGHVRILQSKLFMDLVDKFILKLKTYFPCRDVFSFLLGDFNTLALSEARNLFINGRITSNSPEWLNSVLFKYKSKEGSHESNSFDSKLDNYSFPEPPENLGFDFETNKCIDLFDIKIDEKYDYVNISKKDSYERKEDSDSKGFSHTNYYPFTNKVDGFSGQLDYIYLVEDSHFLDKYEITINNYLPFIDEKLLKPMSTLPSPHYPSDHISVGLDISIVKK